MNDLLDAPIDTRSTDPRVRALLHDLQGNILAGHGRDHAALVFFTLGGNTRASRRFLRHLGTHRVTSAQAQAIAAARYRANAEDALFGHCALTYRGYLALGLAADAPRDPHFRRGMAADGTTLADAPPAQWEAPFRQAIHGVLLLAADTEDTLARGLAGALDTASACDVSIVHVQRGAKLRNAAGEAIEHFGYVDGVSQPLLLAEHVERARESADTRFWNPAFPPRIALVRDLLGAPASYGSYLVLRKLEQDVRRFKRQEQQLADALRLEGDDRELAGALAVGRFENGTPVTMARAPLDAPLRNDFDYAGDDGTRCPYHAHIRKTNPRDAAARSRTMPRRGIPYTDRARTTAPGTPLEASTLAAFEAHVAPLLPEGGVGLLFMAYNHDIGAQFVAMQREMANAPDFPAAPYGRVGRDPIIGQGPPLPGAHRVHAAWDEPSSPRIAVPGIEGNVRLRGGEYFFSPSLSFLRRL